MEKDLENEEQLCEWCNMYDKSRKSPMARETMKRPWHFCFYHMKWVRGDGCEDFKELLREKGRI